MTPGLMPHIEQHSLDNSFRFFRGDDIASEGEVLGLGPTPDPLPTATFTQTYGILSNMPPNPSTTALVSNESSLYCSGDDFVSQGEFVGQIADPSPTATFAQQSVDSIALSQAAGSGLNDTGGTWTTVTPTSTSSSPFDSTGPNEYYSTAPQPTLWGDTWTSSFPATSQATTQMSRTYYNHAAPTSYLGAAGSLTHSPTDSDESYNLYATEETHSVFWGASGCPSLNATTTTHFPTRQPDGFYNKADSTYPDTAGSAAHAPGSISSSLVDGYYARDPTSTASPIYSQISDVYFDNAALDHSYSNGPAASNASPPYWGATATGSSATSSSCPVYGQSHSDLNNAPPNPSMSGGNAGCFTFQVRSAPTVQHDAEIGVHGGHFSSKFYVGPNRLLTQELGQKRRAGQVESSQARKKNKHEIHYCHICEKLFESATILLRHQRQTKAHGNPAKYYYCPGCRKGFPRSDSLNRHMKGSCKGACQEKNAGTSTGGAVHLDVQVMPVENAEPL